MAKEQSSQLPTSRMADQKLPSTVNLKVKQRLTMPLLSMAHLKLLTCQIKGEIYEADITIGAGAEKSSKPHVCLVTNLDTNEDGLLICNEIIRSAISKVEGGYVGKYFQLRSGEIRDGKRYRDIDIVEMEVQQ